MNNDQLRPATGGSIALARGVIIDSRYEILELLGAGGMGTVYKARHLDLNRLAAIKVLHPRYTADAGAVRRFQREARIISKLKHENILSIFGFGGFEQSVYLAMEYVQGVSLGQLVFERKAIQPGEALQYFVQIADAMQHAHDNGVLHRDLKPDNVMMVVSENSDVSPRVVDFGLAKLLDGSDRQRLTRTGEVVGDPRYMSPEQCRGEELDGRSDIYSFGCLMYEVLTGQVPYNLEDPVAIMHNHVSSQPAPFARKQNLPLALESICFKAMTKNRNQRYGSFDAVKVDLERFAKDPNVQIKVPKNKGAWGLCLGDRATVIAVSAISTVLIGVAFGAWTNWDLLNAQARYRFAGSAAEKSRASLALANYYEKKDDFKAAVPLYQETQQLALAANDDAGVMAANAGLARSFGAQQLRDEARLAYLKVLEQGLTLLQHGKLSSAMDQTVLEALGEYAEMEPLPALQMANQFAFAFSARKEAQRGKPFLMKVASVGTDQVRASTLFGLGRLSLQAGDKAESVRFFDLAVATTQHLPGKIAIFQLTGAEFLVHVDVDLALKYLEQASTGLESTGKDKPEDLLRFMGDCYFKKGQFQKAKGCYAQAVAAAKSLSSPDSAQLGFTLDQLGQSAFESSDYQTAEAAFRAESEMLARAAPVNVRQLAWTRCKLGNTLVREKQFGAAGAEFEKALKTLESAPVTPELASIRTAISAYARAAKPQ